MKTKLTGLGVAAVIAASLLSAVGASSVNATSAPGPVTWSDEFSGAFGTAPDPTKWRAESGGSGWGNNELQYYTDSTRNASLDGAGHLVITARAEQRTGDQCWYGACRYTSARLLTAGKFSQRYGRFEARIKIPRGQGMWPAFWMLGANIFTGTPWPASGEIDVLENIGREPSTVHGSMHSPGHSGANSLHGSTSLPGGAALADDFHVFAVEWGTDSITWFLDGTPYSTKTRADLGGDPWPFDSPFFMLLNIAVGGTWPGSPDGSTSFPQAMVVDYVRVSANGTVPTPSSTPTTPPTATPKAAATAIQGYAHKCITAPGSSDGTPLQLRDCVGQAGQMWTSTPDGTLRAYGKCMDVAWGSKADGATVQLVTCNGNAAQRFTLTSRGDLVNAQSDKCVDVADWNATNGARLQQWACAGTANQKWWRIT